MFALLRHLMSIYHNLKAHAQMIRAVQTELEFETEFGQNQIPLNFHDFCQKLDSGASSLHHDYFFNQNNFKRSMTMNTLVQCFKTKRCINNINS